MRVDIVQAPLNIMDRRLITSGWLSKLNYECYFYNTYSKKFIKYKKKISNYKPLTFYFISKNNNYINFLKD